MGISKSYLKELAKNKKFGQKGYKELPNDQNVRIPVTGALKGTKEFYTSFMNSPRYQQMLQGKTFNPYGTFRGVSSDYIRDARLRNLQGSKDNIYTFGNPKDWKTYTGNADDVLGFSKSANGAIYLNPRFYNKPQPETFEDSELRRETLSHEFSHSIDRPLPYTGVRLIPDEDIYEIQDRVLANQREFLKKKGNKRSTWEYLTEPTEIRARINSVRERLWKNGVDIGNKQITAEDIKDINTENLKDLRDVLKEEDIIWMLNNISKTESPQKEKYAQSGAYISTQGYKRNSPDVNNPYNVIPSNQITMKGVDFPVMGTDNMGYQQMMYPGQDYTFPGDYVTEFPMKNMGNKRFAQAGIEKKKKGLYKPDFRTKSQIANAQGQQRENTYVKPVVKNAAQLQRINQIQEQERQRRIKEAADRANGTLRETNDADREAMNREDYTLLGRAQKLGRGDFNPLVLAAGAADLINPAAYWYAGKDLVRGAQEVEKGISNLDLGQVGSGLLQTGLSALYLTPGVRAAGTPIVKNVAPLIKPVVKPVYNAVSSVVNSPKLNYLLEYKRLPKSLENIKKSPEASIEKIVNPKIDQVDQSARSYRFLEGLEKGAASLDESVAKRIKDLESAEGFKRLVAQEKEYLKSINYKGPVNTRAEINAQARINELKGYRNVNKEAGKYRKENIVTSNNEFVKDPDLYNNAYYNIPESNLTNMIVNDLYTPDLSSFNYGSSSQVPFVNIMKSPQLGSKVIPGEIGIGYNFIKNKPIEMHEIAHALQRRRILPFDKEIAKSITPKRYLTSGEKNSYKYFSKGSKKREPSAFLNELRESMQQKGFIPDYYSEIKPEQVQAAYNYFRKNPIGVFKPEAGLGKKFLSNTRIFDFMEPNQSNFQELSRLLNKAPAIVGAVGTGLGVGTLQQNQKPKGTYQGGGTKDSDYMNFVRSLPSNLAQPNDPSYNLRGYWNALGNPESFDYNQPTDPQGYYHAFSRDPRTGQILKAPFHPSFKEGVSDKGAYKIASPRGDVYTQGFKYPAYEGPYALPKNAIIDNNYDFLNKPDYEGYFQGGGTMGIPGVNGQVVSSGPGIQDDEGNVKTMSSKQVKQTLKYSRYKPNKI